MDRVNKYIRFCLKNIPICIAAIGFNAMSGWFRSLGASFLERITDAVEAGITDGLISLIFLGALLQGSSYILRWLGAIMPKYLSAKFGFTLRLELYDKLTHIAYPWYENEQQGNLVSVIRRDTVQAGEAIYAVLSRIISNVFLLVFSIIVMAKTDAVMTALTLAAVCLITWMNQRFLKYISLWTKIAQRTIGQATDTLEKVFTGLETVKTHGAEEFAAGSCLSGYSQRLLAESCNEMPHLCSSHCAGNGRHPRRDEPWKCRSVCLSRQGDPHADRDDIPLDRKHSQIYALL